jgi:type I restriction enzyme R subunit
VSDSRTGRSARGPESEGRTRLRRIDPLLAAQGWTVAPLEPGLTLDRYRAHALTEFPTANGPADYALVTEGQVLGIVEAKKVSLGPQGVLTQAERYAKGIGESPFDFDGRRVPFLYATNGEVIWFQDVRHERNVARRVAGFHTPAGLREMLSRDFDGACAWFERNPNRHPRLRAYQIDQSRRECPAACCGDESTPLAEVLRGHEAP